MLLGNKIRSLRVEQGILQRQVAAYLEIDTPMFSKIERGDRRAKRSQVIQMATYFYIFRWYPFSPLLIFSIVGKDNTFFLNSLLLAQLFLIHARFRHDRPPQHLTHTNPWCHWNTPMASRIWTPFSLFKNCNTVSCKNWKNPVVMMSMTYPHGS